MTPPPPPPPCRSRFICASRSSCCCWNISCSCAWFREYSAASSICLRIRSASPAPPLPGAPPDVGNIAGDSDATGDEKGIAAAAGAAGVPMLMPANSAVVPGTEAAACGAMGAAAGADDGGDTSATAATSNSDEMASAREGAAAGGGTAAAGAAAGAGAGAGAAGANDCDGTFS